MWSEEEESTEETGEKGIRKRTQKTILLCQFVKPLSHCLSLCDPTDCSMSAFPVPHHLPEFAQTHVRFYYLMAPHSSTLAWKIPWTEEPGRLQSMGSLRVGHDSVTSLSLFTFMIGEGNGSPLQYSCLENPRDRGACWAAVCGVAQSRT